MIDNNIHIFYIFLKLLIKCLAFVVNIEPGLCILTLGTKLLAGQLNIAQIYRDNLKNGEWTSIF